MNNTIIVILAILFLATLILRVLKFAVSKIVEILLLLVVLYIGVQIIFNGDLSILETMKNFL